MSIDMNRVERNGAVFLFLLCNKYPRVNIPRDVVEIKIKVLRTRVKVNKSPKIFTVVQILKNLVTRVD